MTRLLRAPFRSRRSRLTSLLISLGFGCSSSALPSSQAPLVAAANEVPSPIAEAKPEPPYLALLNSTEVAWQRAPREVVIGGSALAARQLAPELFAPSGLRIDEEALTLWARANESGKILTGLALAFASPEALETAVSQWPAPQLLRHDSHCARVWLGPQGLRARSLDTREVSPFAPCPSPEANQATLLVEEYLTIDDLLPPQGDRWGFESQGPLLGASLDELNTRFPGRLSNATGSETTSETATLSLPPLQDASEPTAITLGLKNGSVRLIRAEVARGKTEGLDRQATIARVFEKWGELEDIEPHVRMATAQSPRLELELLGNVVRAISQRDTQACPLETNAQSEAAIQSMGDRWIAARELKNTAAISSGALTAAQTPGYVNRGYRLGRSPGTLVHERTLANGCVDHYWTLTRQRTECGTEQIEAEQWGTDCCGPLQCGATAKIWMVRMFNAVQGKDLRLLQKLLDPNGSLKIHSIYGSTEVNLTRANATLASIASFPDWAPQSDGTECSVESDGRTVCVAGPAAYRMHFYWTGSDEQLYLNEIRVDTQASTQR